MVDHRVVVRLGHLGVEAALELEQLALRHAADRVGEDPEDVEVAVLDDHRGRARIEEVADQHRAPVAPDRARRLLAAAQLGEVHHVVVQQRRGVQQLDGGGDLHAARAVVAAQLGGQHQQHRA